ncbi:MAG: hypothetical protein ACTSYA_11655 [Candidatus Kariarchaeaceae archaeon]
MSYVEKALFKYFREMLVGGLKTLFSRRFLPYSLFIAILVFGTTFFIIVEQEDQFISDKLNLEGNDLLELTFLDFMLYLEIAFAVGFILTGILLGKRNTVVQFSAIFLIGTIVLVSFLMTENIELAVLIGAFSYLLWMAITTLASFSMSHDLIGNRFVGSALFFGKPQKEGSILFSIPIFFILIAQGSMQIILLQKAIEDPSLGLYAASISGLIVTLVSLFIIFFLAKTNDVFFTILCFFVAFSLPKWIQLYIEVNWSDNFYGSWFDFLIVGFFLLYSVSKFSKKALKVQEAHDRQLLKAKKKRQKRRSLKKKVTFGLLGRDKGNDKKIELEDTGEFSSVFSKLALRFGDRGIILVLLGLVLGFHVLQLQFMTGRTDLLEMIFFASDNNFGQISHQVSIIGVSLLFAAVLVGYALSANFRENITPDIKRFDWLPPFDDFIILANKVRTGEISKKKLSIRLMSAYFGSKIPFKGGDIGLEEKFKGILEGLINEET